MTEEIQELNPYANWNEIVSYLAYASWIIAGLIVIIYALRLAMISSNKGKYNFISRYEVKFLLISSFILILGTVAILNSNITTINNLVIFARVFLSVAGGLVVGVVFQAFFKFYYPFYIEKRLKTLRYKPRISPKTGNPMKLLSEEEEDAYLDEGMQAEENVFSIDYDVWIDETGYTQIEKYAGHLHALRCEECNYQTLKLIKEEVVSEPTTTQKGELLKHFKCTYCNTKASKAIILKELTSEVPAK